MRPPHLLRHPGMSGNHPVAHRFGKRPGCIRAVGAGVMQRHLPHAPVGTRRQAAVILQGTYPGRILLPVDLRAPAAPLVERAVAQHIAQGVNPGPYIGRTRHDCRAEPRLLQHGIKGSLGIIPPGRIMGCLLYTSPSPRDRG